MVHSCGVDIDVLHAALNHCNQGLQPLPGSRKGAKSETAVAHCPAQAALKAAVEGMELCGEGEAEPPEGAMKVRPIRQSPTMHAMLPPAWHRDLRQTSPPLHLASWCRYA